MASSHRGDIQGLRGLAVLLVVVFHSTTGLSGGFVGVDVFFAISGFVICRLLLGELRSTGRVSLATFYLRRFRRLLPALAFMLGFVVLFSFLAVPVRLHNRTTMTGASTALFSGNLYLFLKAQIGYFDPVATSNPLLHTWSLSVEEQFYFLFPTALTVLAWIARKRSRGLVPVLAVGLGAIALSSFAMSWAFVDGLPHVAKRQRLIDFAFYSSPTRAWEFALGALLALCAIDYETLANGVRGRMMLTGIGFLGALMVGVSALVYSDKTLFPGPSALIPVVGTCCLIIAGGHARGLWGRLLGNRLLVGLGDISYGWYLWHWPFIVIGRSLFPQSTHAAVIAAVASLIPAWVSLKFVENPIRFAASPSPRKTLRLAVVCVVLPLLAAATVSAVGSTAAAAKLDIEKDADLVWVAPFPCVFGRGNDVVERARCTVTSAVNRRRVFLVGDSNATQFTQVFNKVASELDVDSSVRAWLGCPFIDAKGISGRNVDEASRCRTFVEETILEIEKQRPAVVVISHSVDEYLELATFSIIDKSGIVAIGKEAKKATWRKAQQRMIDRVRATGAKVILTQPIPRFGEWQVYSCVPLLKEFMPSRCVASHITKTLRARREEIRSFVQSMEQPGVSIVDYFDELCPDAAVSCTTRQNGHWLWSDGQHLTKHGASLVRDDLRAALSDLLK